MTDLAARTQAYEANSRWLSYKFDRYREDGTNPSWHTTRAEHSNWELPVPKELRHGLRPGQGPVEFQPIEAVRAPDFLDTRVDEVGLHKAERVAWRRLQFVHNWLPTPSITYRGILGYGEHNLATHWQHDDGKGNIRDFVLKCSLRNSTNDPRIRREGKMLAKVRRSQHVIQTIDPKEFGLERSPGPSLERAPIDDSDYPYADSGDDSLSDIPRIPKQKRKDYGKTQRKIKEKAINWAIYMNTDVLSIAGRTPTFAPSVSPAGRNDYLLLEYMPNGTLEDFIFKLNELDVTCPNRVLWSFWVCLIRACIAMAYPVHTHNKKRKDPKITGALSEMVPGNPVIRKKIRPMVHFAIEPRNVLVGHIPTDVTHGEHLDEVTPILKLAGWGQSEVIRGQRRNWYYERRRTNGRHGYYAPEQFTEMWDKFALTMDGDDICDEPLAGKYGWAMNVWGIALTLLCVITRSEPTCPPRASPIKVRRRKGDTRPKWWDHYTYGAMLLNEGDNKLWSYVDQELREVLAKCLARDPANRPDLQTLLDLALSKCEDDGTPYVYADGETAATNDFVYKFMGDILRNSAKGASNVA
ncbi:hypothetical protein KJ359_006739 [Pestalotiopsis sp. 9143b]|nr:hypothetical protein KJ359_006739 [Pestalotiopsis sp. 9143b]